jgi:hypothetical protein
MKLCRTFEMTLAVRVRRAARWCVGTLTLGVALLAFGCHHSTDSSTADGVQPNSQVVTPTSFEETNGGEEYNASGVVPLGDSRFLFCDNHVANALYELDLTADGRKQGALIRRPLQGLEDDSVDDLEGMTLAEENGRRFVFVTSSLCLKKARREKHEKPVEVPSNGLLRVTINPDHGLRAENMPGFRDWLIRHEPELAAAARLVPNDGGLNIEGLAWDPRRHALLFGVRTPVPNGKPLVVPVKVKDLAGPWTTDNLEMLAPIRLAPEATTDEQGIRSLEYIESFGSFLVVTGKSIDNSKAPFTLYEWDGQPAGTLRRLAVSFHKKMKPEGLTAGIVGGKPVLLFVDDDGGYQVMRPATLHP